MSAGPMPPAPPAGTSPPGQPAGERPPGADSDPLAGLFVRIGAMLGFAGVAAGAFGTHALRDSLAPALAQAFETGVRYQLIHALALLSVGIIAERRSGRLLAAAGWLFTCGTLLFSGSLYALALTGRGAFGAITPLGGLALLAGWVTLAVAGLPRRTG